MWWNMATQCFLRATSAKVFAGLQLGPSPRGPSFSVNISRSYWFRIWASVHPALNKRWFSPLTLRYVFFFWNLSAPESVVLFLSVAVFSVTTSPSPSVRTSFARVRGRKKNLFLSATSRWGPPLWSWYRRTSPVGWRTCSTRSPEGCIRGSWWRCAACQPWTACASCSTCSSGARSSSWGLRGGRERSKFYHSYSAQAFDLFFLYDHRTHAIHILTSTGQRLWMRTARMC